MTESLKKTPLNEVHHQLKARMVDFAGWELPVWYTSVLEEHKTVRSAAGIFDVSDMGRVLTQRGQIDGMTRERSLSASIKETDDFVSRVIENRMQVRYKREE
jgi:glycine cleavage system aminomethyltransferase T